MIRENTNQERGKGFCVDYINFTHSKYITNFVSMEGNLELQVDPNIENIRFYFDNIVCVCVMCFSVAMFDRNDTFFTIAFVLSISIFLVLSRSMFKIYDDKIEIISQGFWDFNTHTHVFYYNDIASINTTFRFENSRFFLNELMIATNSNGPVGNYFTIQPKNGKKVDCVIDAPKKDLIDAFELVEKLSANKFEIIDLYRKYPLWQ